MRLSKEIFTIIAPDYDGVVTSYARRRFVDSLLQQSFPLWRLLLIHDGPRTESVPCFSDSRIECLSTAERANDWGHSQRAYGLSIANGELIWIINPDNVIYPHSLAIAHAYSLNEKRTSYFRVGSDRVLATTDNPEVLICAIRMMGLRTAAHTGGHIRLRGYEANHQLLLAGWPPKKYNVDAMSLIAKASIYRDFGWPYKHEDSDGDVIEGITSKHGYMLIPEILGEHW
jgi:hypothetical protein